MLTLGDVFVMIKGDSKGLDRSLSDAEQKTRSFAGNVGGFLQTAFSMATGNVITSALNAVTNALGAIKDGMIGGNTAFEQYNTAFTVLIGNADLAQQRMEELADFGQRTPFELPGLVEGDRVLQSFGLHAADIASRFGKSGEEIRTISGDIASGVGTSFQEIANLIGRFSAGATGEAISRMQELGITTRSELAAMGVEFDKSGSLVSPLDEAMTTLLQVVEQRFGGMMEAQSKTFGGMMSNLQDWVGQTLRTLGAPFFDRFKEGLTSVLAFLQPGGAADTVIKNLAQTFELLLSIAQQVGSALLGDVGGSISDFVTLVGEKLQQVNEFLRQLKDEIAGLTAGDIFGELGPGLAALDAKMQDSLSQLEQSHQTTIASIEGQLQRAGETLGQEMAKIAEEYGPKIEQVSERFAKSIASLNQRLGRTVEDFNAETVERAEAHAKKRTAIEKEIADTSAKLEEKLTQLKKDHLRRRNELVTSLLTVESEEQYLQIQEQIKAEDEKYNEQVEGTKKAGKEQVSELEDRLKEEDAAFAKQEAKRQKMHDRETGDLRASLAEQAQERDKALAEINTERAKEEAAVQDAYNKQTELLNNRLAAEKASYEQNQADIKAIYQQQMADLEAEINARAAAIGSGPAAQAGAFIRDLIDKFNELKTTVSDFITNNATPLIGVLIGIGAVLAGGVIIGALTALAGALAGVSVPILAIIGGLAILYTAWAQNWFDIQGKTQAVIDFLQPYWDRLKVIFAEFADNILPKLQLAWDTLVLQWEEKLQPALTRLLEALGLGQTASMNLETAMWLIQVVLDAISLALNVLNPLIELFGSYLEVQVDTITTVVGWLNSLRDAGQSLAKMFRELTDNIVEYGEALLGLGEKLPPWLKPGSPTPLELGIEGISSAIKKIPDITPKIEAGGLQPQLQPILDQIKGGGQGLVQFSQTNYLPAAPTGFDADGLMKKIDANTIDLLLQYSEASG